MTADAHDNATSGSTSTFHVVFEPVGRRGQCQEGLHLLGCAHSIGVQLAAVCGGRGTCGRCRVILASGTLSPVTSIEQSVLSAADLAGGVRLACQAIPQSDCTIHVPEESMTSTQRVQVEGLQSAPETDPVIIDHRVTVPPATLDDVRGDAERVRAALEESSVSCDTLDVEAARALPRTLRMGGWALQASMRDRELVATGPSPSPTLGIAVDLGTTKIAAYLLDLSTGATLAARGTMNPQIRFGEDVVSRLSHVLATEGGALELSTAATGAINSLVSDLADEADVDPTRIIEAVIVGNTAMHHLVLTLPVDQLSRAPYVPAVRDSLDIKARELGLDIGRGAYVHFPPNIAGFVGSDHVAALLSTGIGGSGAPALLIDIGTNTEVCLAIDGHLTSVSCASGPAFEGGHIRDGMRAASGAIEHVQIDGDEVRVQTVDDAAPSGICGSGILDALSELARRGIVDTKGRLSPEHPRVKHDGRTHEFVLVTKDQRDGKPALGITQGDIRQLQLAKSAIATGIQSLLDKAGIEQAQLASVIVAGAFGSYIDLDSAISIGMLPTLPLDRFRQVGNAAGAGAKMVLTSRSRRAAARDLAKHAGYLELATAKGFMKQFVDNTALVPFKPHGG